jgi:hypothetical protein
MENQLKEAFRYLVDTGREIADKAVETPQILDIKGETYIAYKGELERFSPNELSCADSTEIFSLDGLIDFIHADVDGFFGNADEKCIVLVKSPTEVIVVTPCKGMSNSRWKLASCTYAPPRIAFNSYMDAEDLGIMLQTNFVEDENRDIILKIVRNMTEEQSLQTADDGVSQRVTIKQGVKEIDSTVFKNPAYLRPLRTFTEVMQPFSPFVVRFAEGHKAALLESDGGAWRVEAVRYIGNYLKDKLQDSNVVVIA